MVIFAGCVGGFLTYSRPLSAVCIAVFLSGFNRRSQAISLSRVLATRVGGCKIVYVCVNMWVKKLQNCMGRNCSPGAVCEWCLWVHLCELFVSASPPLVSED